ncbi:MAG TPA: TonB-dependent receptor [Archangium sp.]|uniref:TonB-dependent receptor n=1 Tax=Archangium sp. TaxID=1872627 RepID=UPI002ED8733D
MRLKTLVLCSMSIAMLTASAEALAQTAETRPDAGQPPADAGVVAEYNPDEFVEEIAVVGLQRSMQKAQTVKRDSDQIVDTVVAEDIGKLPDVTVSETAARIPGVQVVRERGEAGGQVLVRGLPDVTTTYNGREIFTAETRNVALGDFPAGGIAALEVYKSTTADQIEGGLAGLIDVRSRRPFDFEGFELSGATRGTYANQSGKFDPNGNVLVSNRWRTGLGEVGALINLSYTRLNYLDSARWNSGVIGNLRSEAGEQFRAPEVVGIFYGGGKRERPSVNGSAQWRPAPGLEFYVDGLWQGYRDHVSDRLLEMRLGGGLTNVTLRPGTMDQAQSLTAAEARPFMFQGATFRKTNTSQLAVGGSYETGPLRITADVARTNSKFDMSIYSFDQGLTSNPTMDVNFDVPRGPGGMEFSLPNFDMTDPANFRFIGFFDRSYVAAGDDWQARTDFDVNTGVSFIPKLEAGLRYTTRDAYQQNGERYGTLMGGTPLSEMPVDLHVFRGGFRGSDIQQTRTWVVPTYESLRSNGEQLRAMQNFTPGGPKLLNLFEANERNFAGYGQARYEFKVGELRVDGVVGLRAVRTNTTVTIFPTETTTQTDSGSYTDLLPNASARLRLIRDLQLRLSASQTRTRPGFEQMRPIVLGSPPPCLSEPSPPPSCQVTGSGGNPDLEPVRSTNFDATLEYYFLQTGMASLAVFRRDIDGFVTNLDVTRDHPTYGPGRTRVNIPVNGGEGRIQGFEASAGTFLDFLPGWLGGFGAYANVTYLDDQQAFPTGFELELGETGRIPGVSKWSYNLVAMYEREKLSARLAYNQRSRWISAYVQNPAGEGFTGEFVDGVSRLDFSGSYSPWEKVTFTFDASNILGNPFRNFRQFTPEGSTYPRDVRYEESVYSLGVRVRI